MELTFTKKGVCEVCTMTPTALTTIQVDREKRATFTVYAHLESMQPVCIYNSSDYKDVLLQIEVPQGVTVELVSFTHVTAAKTL